ncbi:MAG: DUF5615 family PIN-like protein [Pyrinomonadaceae bacterium]
MKIVTDESVERQIVMALRSAGHEVIDIKEISPGIDDAEVLRVASSTLSILITNDKDFGELIFRDRSFSKGVVLLRFGTLDLTERADLLGHVLEENKAELLGSFTVITPAGVRIRK